MSRRPVIPIVLALLVAAPLLVAGVWLLAGGGGVGTTGGAGRPDPTPGLAADPSVTTPRPTPVPIPGHEVYGFVPYWEMDDSIAAHVARTPLTTLGLFSVTNRGDGSIDTKQTGYRRITGSIGQQLIRQAHQRGTRVELVYTSFGVGRNSTFFADPDLQATTIGNLVTLARRIGVDGINVDVESIDPLLATDYGTFVGELRTALRAALPSAQVSVATTAGNGGATMARAAADAGADRIFVMAYDYHWTGSAPGASAPMGRIDGSIRDLPWTLELYYDAGVPVQRTILGLPLYGVSWPVSGPEIGADDVGTGDVFIPRQNLPTLTDPTLVPQTDPVEVVSFLATPTDEPGVWRAIYYDTPETLTPKLELANERGLAGAGFWAIGYERGLPGYTALISTFRDGSAAPVDPGDQRRRAASAARATTLSGPWRAVRRRGRGCAHRLSRDRPRVGPPPGLGARAGHGDRATSRRPCTRTAHSSGCSGCAGRCSRSRRPTGRSSRQPAGGRSERRSDDDSSAISPPPGSVARTPSAGSRSSRRARSRPWRHEARRSRPSCRPMCPSSTCG